MNKIMLYITLILVTIFLVKAFDLPPDAPNLDPTNSLAPSQNIDQINAPIPSEFPDMDSSLGIDDVTSNEINVQTSDSSSSSDLGGTLSHDQEIADAINNLRQYLDEKYLTQAEIYQLITSNSVSRDDVNQIINERMNEFSPVNNTGPYLFNLILLFGLIGVFVFALHIGSVSSKVLSEYKPKLTPIKSFQQPLQVREIRPVLREGLAFDAMVEYVKKNKTKPGIKNRLVKTGWSFEEVNEAFRRAK